MTRRTRRSFNSAVVAEKAFFKGPSVEPSLRESFMTTKAHKVAILPGDGIGPEVVDATLLVLDAVQKTGLVHLAYLTGDAGFDSIKKSATNILENTVEVK